MRHHCPIKYCIPNQFFNRNNKAFNIKVHTVIDRCRLVVTHWNKCVTLKLFSRKCNSWWILINLNDADYYNALNSVKALESVPNSPPFPPRHDTVLWTRSGAWRGLTLPLVSLRKKNQFFPHAFALRYSNFKAFSFRNAKDVNFKFRYEYNNELTFSS